MSEADTEAHAAKIEKRKELAEKRQRLEKMKELLVHLREKYHKASAAMKKSQLKRK